MTSAETVLQFAGAKPGPALLISAGVHGDEFIPVLAVMELARLFQPGGEWAERLRGTLTLIPVANPGAFALGQRRGPDGLDLARVCPGNIDGTPTERAAAALSGRIHDADFYIDLHTGGAEFCVWPLAGFTLHPDPTIRARQRELARAFGLPLVWGTAADLPGRSLSVARDAGVPAIYVEYFGGSLESLAVGDGGSARWSDPPDRSALEPDDGPHPLVRGCLSALRHLGMLPEDAVRPAPACLNPVVIEDHRPGSGHMQVSHPAPVAGLFQRAVAPGQWVSRGQPLGSVIPLDGGSAAAIPAEEEGLVVTLRWIPRVNQGEAVAVIAANHPSA
jgi:predicted deacylase